MLVRCFNFAHGEKVPLKWSPQKTHKTDLKTRNRLAIVTFIFFFLIFLQGRMRQDAMAQREVSKICRDLKIERLSLRKRV